MTTATNRQTLEASRDAFLQLVGQRRQLDTAAGDLFAAELSDVRLYSGHVARHYDLTLPRWLSSESRVQINEGDDDEILREIVADILHPEPEPPDLFEDVENGDTALHR